MNFTFGSDPEFALAQKGQFKDAIGILPEKKKAIKLGESNFYFDNVLAEVGIRPTKNKQEATSAIRSVLQDLQELVRPAKITVRASMNFPASELKHKKAMEAGCVAEYSAYTLRRIVPPVEFVVKDEDTEEMRHVTSFRTVGGHIHLGGEGVLQHGMLQPYIIKMMDLFIGIPELFFNKDKTARDRRQVYGVAGSHRRPEYGVEYRPLSNYWFSSPVYSGLIYDLCDFVLKFVEKKGHLKFWQINEDLLDEDDPSVAHRCYGYDVNLLRQAIDQCDKKLAKPFLTLVANELPDSLYQDIEAAIDYQPLELNEEWSIK